MHDHVVSPLSLAIFWIAAALCVIAELAILRYAFFPHRGDTNSATVPQSPRGIEMIWAIVPAIILAILLAATWRAVNHQ